MKNPRILLIIAAMSAAIPMIARNAFASDSGEANSGSIKVDTPAAARSFSGASASAADAIVGSSWQCQWSEGAKVNFVLSFDASGRFFVTRDGRFDPFAGKWETRDGDVTWSDSAGRLYTLRAAGDRLAGKTSTLDLRQSRGREYNGTIGCIRMTVTTPVLRSAM